MQVLSDNLLKSHVQFLKIPVMRNSVNNLQLQCGLCDKMMRNNLHVLFISNKEILFCLGHKLIIRPCLIG